MSHLLMPSLRLIHHDTFIAPNGADKLHRQQKTTKIQLFALGFLLRSTLRLQHLALHPSCCLRLVLLLRGGCLLQLLEHRDVVLLLFLIILTIILCVFLLDLTLFFYR